MMGLVWNAGSLVWWVDLSHMPPKDVLICQGIYAGFLQITRDTRDNTWRVSCQQGKVSHDRTHCDQPPAGVDSQWPFFLAPNGPVRHVYQSVSQSFTIKIIYSVRRDCLCWCWLLGFQSTLGTCPHFWQSIRHLGNKKLPCSLGIGRAMIRSLQKIVLKLSPRKYRSSLDQTPLVWTCLSPWVLNACQNKKLKTGRFSMAKVTPL